MEDPLTPKQKEDFEALLVIAWQTEYQHALASGGFPEMDEGSFIVAKIAACCLDRRLNPFLEEGKEMLRNYRNI